MLWVCGALGRWLVLIYIIRSFFSSELSPIMAAHHSSPPERKRSNKTDLKKLMSIRLNFPNAANTDLMIFPFVWIHSQAYTIFFGMSPSRFAKCYRCIDSVECWSNQILWGQWFLWANNNNTQKKSTNAHHSHTSTKK